MELLQFLQLATSALVITIYALFHALQGRKAIHLSECHMVLLTAFLIKHHPEIKSLSKLVEASDKDLVNLGDVMSSLKGNLDTFENSGNLPPPIETVRLRILEFLILVLIAPVTIFIGVKTFFSEVRKYKVQRIRHTELRKNYFSKDMLLLFVNIFYLFLLFQFIFPIYPCLTLLFSAPMIIGIGLSVIHMATFIYLQQSWKEYWQVKFLDVMAIAENKDNHDLFNRAMIFKDYVESQPDIPIPGNLGFYAVIYSIIQFLLLWIFNVI